MQTIYIAHKGTHLSIGQYVAIIKSVKSAAPGTQYRETLNSWYGGTREDILREFSQMVTDKINEHLPVKNYTETRLFKLMASHIKSECRWCGHSLNQHKPRHLSFCSDQCRRSHSY